MKNCKVLLLVFVAALLSMPMMAQDAAPKATKKSAKKAAKEAAASVSQLDEKEQKMILNYTRNLSKVDVKKEMKKSMKKMSAEDRQKVMEYIAKVEKKGDDKPVAIVKDLNVTAPPAPATAPSAPKVDKSTQPKYVMKDQAVDPSTITQIEILDPTYDFGTIQQNDKAETVYRVKNVGSNPLKISKAKGSCGCTVPQWPKEEIAPGEIAEIKVVFNSRGKKGKQNKRITITANTEPADSYMTITGMVEVPAAPESPVPVEDKQ